MSADSRISERRERDVSLHTVRKKFEAGGAAPHEDADGSGRAAEAHVHEDGPSYMGVVCPGSTDESGHDPKGCHA